jgi:hypothetical protein
MKYINIPAIYFQPADAPDHFSLPGAAFHQIELFEQARKAWISWYISKM